MSDETRKPDEVEAAEVIQQAEDKAPPATVDEAMERLLEKKQETDKASVGNGGGGEKADSGAEGSESSGASDEGSTTDEGDGGGGPPADDSQVPAPGPDVQEESPAAPAPIDTASILQGMAKAIEDEAQRLAIKQFSDAGLKPFSIQNLYRKSDDGTVEFINPDTIRNGDPATAQTFASRAEAQSWVDMSNRQLQDALGQVIKEQRSALVQENKHQIQWLQFAPEVSKMNQTEQAVMGKIIGEYAVTRNGKVVGFDCDLKKAKAQAIAIAKDFTPAQTQAAAPEKPAPEEPAVDMKTTSTGGGTGKDTEPETIDEAMDVLLQQRKAKKNG